MSHETADPETDATDLLVANPLQMWMPTLSSCVQYEGKVSTCHCAQAGDLKENQGDHEFCDPSPQNYLSLQLRCPPLMC